jgi:phage terminase large subunit
VIPNQGRGAAKQRVEAGWRHFDACWFNEATTQGGLEALGWYHEKKDEKRDIGLGPEHDWSSHGADSFGLGMFCVERIWNESGKTIADPYAGLRRHG